MKKILIIGKLKQTEDYIVEYLKEDYNVEFCSMRIENVQGVVKIFTPDLIIVNELDRGEVEKTILDYLDECHGNIPILIICSEADWDKSGDIFEDNGYEILYTPISREHLFENCARVMNMDPEEYKAQVDAEIGKKKLLLVDDNAIALRNIKGILQDKYEVRFAVSGEMAVKAIEKEKPDLILLDYEMPGMDGVETFEKIKEIDLGKELPVVFLTSVSEKRRIIEVLKLNPAGYILKPVDQEKLLDVVEKALEDAKGEEDET